jgi:hypothetical protein
MKKLMALFIFLFIIPIPALAQTISIGVQPTEITYDTNKTVMMRFWNTPADTDAEFWVAFEDPLQNHTICDWCNHSFTVPNSTDRIDNPVIKTMVFTKQPNEEFNGRMFVYAKPVGANITGMVSIQPRVAVRIFAIKATTTTTTSTTTTTIISTTTTPQTTPTTTQSDGNFWDFLFPKSTTTTTTIKIYNYTNLTTTTIRSNTSDFVWPQSNYSTTTIENSQEAGFDIIGILTNPIVLMIIIAGSIIGVGLLVFFLLNY